MVQSAKFTGQRVAHVFEKAIELGTVIDSLCLMPK